MSMVAFWMSTHSQPLKPVAGSLLWRNDLAPAGLRLFATLIGSLFGGASVDLDE